MWKNCVFRFKYCKNQRIFGSFLERKQMTIKKINIILAFLLVPFFAYSQAGRGVYQFLNLPASSRIAALGGTNISHPESDINFAFVNPALLSSQTDQIVGLNYANYIADVNFGTAIYGMNFGEGNFMSFGVKYFDYGQFLWRDKYNQSPGGDVDLFFGGQDLALYITYARQLSEKITIGTTFKPIFSSLETYRSYGIAVDVGLSYVNPEKLFSAGLVFRNIGAQIRGYHSNADGEHIEHREPLAFDIQLGVTQRLQHAPLRFSFTLHNLQQWNLAYQSTNQPSTSFTPGNEPNNEIGFLDMAFRHAIISAEFVPSDNFYVSIGYNHRRLRELSLTGFRSLSGFSFGSGIKVHNFHVGFAMTQFQTGINSYQFSVATSLNQFRL